MLGAAKQRILLTTKTAHRGDDLKQKFQHRLRFAQWERSGFAEQTRGDKLAKAVAVSESWQYPGRRFRACAKNLPLGSKAHRFVPEGN